MCMELSIMMKNARVLFAQVNRFVFRPHISLSTTLKLHVTCIISTRKRYMRFPTTLEHNAQINRIYVNRRSKQKSEVAFSMIAF